MFYDILERKNARRDYIKKRLKKSKNWDLFWSKIGNLSMFLF